MRFFSDYEKPSDVEHPVTINIEAYFRRIIA